jgi:NADP-dependent 3-hydroxy acid dehydrogenase YdfG
VTGAGAGIGLSIAKNLLANASTSLVIGVDINTIELEILLEPYPDRLAVVQGDVSDRSVDQKAVETAINRRGKLDCIILNAGILRPVGPSAATAVAEWKQLFDVNFFALVHAVSMTRSEHRTWTRRC